MMFAAMTFMSMTFASIFETKTLIIIAVALFALATLLYLLKLKKRRVEVPFSPIWARVLETRNELEQWRRHLRRILSWLLFIIIAALIYVAILDPHQKNEALEARHVLILIDNSASMDATDVSGAATRLDLAKKSAQEALQRFDAQDKVMLATFDTVVRPRTPYLSEPSILAAALDDIKVSATGTDFGQALEFAADSLKDAETKELILITDGADASFSELLDTPASAQAPSADSPTDDTGSNIQELKERLQGTKIDLIQVGEVGDNLAITAFNARRYLTNRLDFELLVQVESFFDRPIDATIDLFADGKLIDSKPISIEPKGLFQQFYPSQAVSGEKLQARVRIRTSDAQDVFPLDDTAYTYLAKPKIVDLLLVSSGNLYLEGPLLLNPNIKYKRLSPTQYEALPESEKKKFDIIIFDQYTGIAPDTSNVFYINPSGPNSPWKARDKDVADPIIARTKKGHPLLRWMTLADMNILTAKRLITTTDDVVVAASVDGTPMILTRDTGSRKEGALTFDIRASDFPLRVSFPIFIINLIDWFTQDAGTLSQSVKSGEAWEIDVPEGVENVILTPPSVLEQDQLESDSTTERTSKTAELEDATRIETFPVLERRAQLYGTELGFYRVTSADPSHPFVDYLASNLSNRIESDILPRQLDLPDELKQAPEDRLIKRASPWIWLVLIAMALLSLEWFTYHRRITE